MTDPYLPPVEAVKLGAGEPGGGYQAWCVERERQAPFKYPVRHHNKLLFSVVVPVHKPKKHWLQECIDSVRSQFFADWELILANDASTQPILDLLKKNQALDSRIKISLTSTTPGISATSNRAAHLATGDYLVFLDHDDLLDPYALSAFAQRLQTNAAIDILYADEDRFNDHYQRLHPGFKPQFSLEKLRSTNYIHHPVVMRRSLFNELEGLNSAYDGSQDYDLLLRAVEKNARIEHIPDVLYHMRLHSGSLSSGADAKPDAHAKGINATQAYLKRQAITAVIKPSAFAGHHNLSYPLIHRPKTSLLLLVNTETPQEAIRHAWQQHPDIEILICTNHQSSIPIRLNQLARQAQGEVLIFADGQLQPAPGCIDELLGHCQHEDVGLVTAKLAYNDAKLHSCGLTLGIKGCAGRWHYACHADDLGYGGWMGINHEVSAVPWQLMAITKQHFLQAGLFDEHYLTQGFDIHLALRLSSLKPLRHITLATTKATFPYPCPLQQESWQQQDFLYLWSHWHKRLNQSDPYFHPQLSIYDESINFISPAELYFKRMGLFNAFDKLSAQLLWQCCRS